MGLEVLGLVHVCTVFFSTGVLNCIFSAALKSPGDC